MADESKPNIRVKIINFFGGLGYLICIIQWLWSILLYFEPIIELAKLVSPAGENKLTPVDPVIETSPNLAATIFAVVITLVVVVFCVFIIIKLPKIAAQKSNEIIHKTAINTVPLLMKITHKKNNPKNKLKLTVALIFSIKITLVIVPVLLAYASRLLSKQAFPIDIALLVSLFWASVSLTLFGIEYLMAHLLKVDKKKIW